MGKWRDTEMWEFMGNWTFILTRMQSFILQNQEVLQRERKDYNLTKRNVLGVVNKERGGNDLLSLFVDDKKTGKALVWLEMKSYRMESHPISMNICCFSVKY